MNTENIYKQLLNILPEDSIRLNEPMSKHTSIKIGGPADFFIKVKTIEEIKQILKIIKDEKLNYKIIGNGSNILVKDEGFRGVIIKNEIDYVGAHCMRPESTIINVPSGTKNAILAQYCLKNGLEGFEFASGIPGTIGGAIKMNAGAHGSEMKDIVDTVTYIDDNENIVTIKNEQCEFEYRNSLFGKQNYIILSVTLKLREGNINEIKEKLDVYKKFRIEKQPIELPNAGSTFKRGTDFITAKLIDDAGLKGYSIGGAQVSEKHAGFIVNKGNATAEDVINLAKYVQETVYKKFNKKIELEIEII